MKFLPKPEVTAPPHSSNTLFGNKSLKNMQTLGFGQKVTKANTAKTIFNYHS
jgi:hypothetical protein